MRDPAQVIASIVTGNAMYNRFKGGMHPDWEQARAGVAELAASVEMYVNGSRAEAQWIGIATRRPAVGGVEMDPTLREPGAIGPTLRPLCGVG